MIRIAAGVDLPDELVTEVTGILARRSAGKTYTAKKMAEQVIKRRLPLVILDPLGAFWGLRSSLDGLGEGLPVVIFGGAHADVPLTVNAGKEIAEVVVDHPGAYIIDLSHFDTKGEEITFATAFLERLYRYKAQHPSALLLIVDEADTFAPQKPETREIKMLGSMESIVRRGRLRGIGVILITQRAAVLNKNCLTQVELLVLLQTTSPQDRKAVLAWIEAKSAEDEQKEVMSTIGGLNVGEAWLWSPAWLKILKRVQILPAETFDSSKTPKPGEAIVEPVRWTKVDLEALGAKIAATVARARENDPEELRRRYDELKKERDYFMAETDRVRAERVPVAEPVAIIAAGDIERLEKVVSEIRLSAAMIKETAEEAMRWGRDLEETGGSIGAQLEQWAPGRVAPNVATFGAPMKTAPVAAPQLGRFPNSNLQDDDYEPAPPPAAADIPAGDLGKGADRAFLAALAQFPDGLSFNRAAFLAGYAPTVSTTRNALSSLRTRGYATGFGKDGDPLRITPAGLSALGTYERAPTGRALIDYWHSKLGKAQQAFFMALVDQHPRPIPQDEAAQLAGYDPKVSTTRNTVSSLRSLGLIVGGSNSLALSPELVGG